MNQHLFDDLICLLVHFTCHFIPNPVSGWRLRLPVAADALLEPERAEPGADAAIPPRDPRQGAQARRRQEAQDEGAKVRRRRRGTQSMQSGSIMLIIVFSWCRNQILDPSWDNHLTICIELSIL